MAKPPRQLSTGFVEALLEAFPPNPAPKLAELIHNNCQCEQCEFVRKNLNAQPWDQLSERDVEQLATDLSLFSRKAFIYYLPAYLRRAYESKSESLVEWIVFSFAPDCYGPADFSSAQRLIVHRFLNWAGTQIGNRDAQKYLASWERL